MNSLAAYYFYLLVVFIAFLFSLSTGKNSGAERKYLSALLLLTLVSEAIADILSSTIRINLAVYHFFNPLQLCLVALYFNEIIPEFKAKGIGIYISITSVVLGASNAIWIQNLKNLNSNFLLFESICIITMSLHMFYYLIRNDEIQAFRNQHFWISLVMLLFWSITYTFWGLSNAFDENVLHLIPTLGGLLATVNILTYSALAIIFFLTRKNKLSL
ncbi:MAG: hypothetical protein JNL72_02595 [Flavipsychrobacter sp.]|nr:hypothetical protein [Flavipsychrobacter sp.]